MVFTLHRYIFREIFKVFVLAMVALTLILSLGGVLRPIQEFGVGPRQALQLIYCFLPVTLTFVLPMAALFASALVYGRLAGDNELDACRASGMSMATLVYPGMILAIAVAVANILLSFQVVPEFIHLAESSLKANAKEILFRNIQRKGYYEMPPDKRFRIYADLASGPDNALGGVVVMETESRGWQTRRIITADSASVSFTPHDKYNQVRVTAHNSYQADIEAGGWFYAKTLSLSMEFGSLLTDDIKFKKLHEMKKIRLDPLRFAPIEKLARGAAVQLTAELLAADISDTPPGQAYRLYSGQKNIELIAGACTVRNDNAVELSGGVKVYLVDIDEPRKPMQLECSKSVLHIEGDELAPTATLEIHNPIERKPDGTEHLAGRQIVRGLILPGSISEKLDTGDLLHTLTAGSVARALGRQPGHRLQSQIQELDMEIHSTLNEITAEIHSRLVFGIGCVAIIAISIALGIIKKGGHLLGAFGVSSIPAAALIVSIMTGRNMTKNLAVHNDAGLILMWVFLAVLSVVALALHHKLTRN